MANVHLVEQSAPVYLGKPDHHDIIVVGGSSGALVPLLRMLSDLPEGLPAAILVTLHRSRGGKHSLELLSKRSPLNVTEATDGSALRPGTVVVAPADRHLLLENGMVRVIRGPRENNARPSIDVLYRSAAVEFGSRVGAVLLSGTMSDGIAGLLAVKRCGGATVVQDPDDATFAELPARAIQADVADHVADSTRLADLVISIVSKSPPDGISVPEDLQMEARHAAMHMESTSETALLGEPAGLACPDCNGPMWRVGGKGEPARFRCEVGHAHTTDTLLEEQGQALERALWIAYRTLKERSKLVQDMADDAGRRGHKHSAEHYAAVVRDLEEHAATVKAVLEAGVESPPF